MKNHVKCMGKSVNILYSAIMAFLSVPIRVSKTLSMFGAIVLVFALAAQADPPPENPSAYNGAYSVRIGGFYHGTGTAHISVSHVKIDAQLQTDGGEVVLLNATLPRSGNTFQGTATVTGRTFQISGRLEAGSRGGNALIARMFCTFKVTDGHCGRVVGVRD